MTVPALLGGGVLAERVLGGAGEVQAVRTSNSPVRITLRESRLLVIALTSLSVRAFDPVSLFGLILPPLTKPRQDPTLVTITCSSVCKTCRNPQPKLCTLQRGTLYVVQG